MVRHIKKLWHSFLKYPILTTLLFCGAAALVFTVIYVLVCDSNDFDLVVLLCVSIVFLPFVLTAENILLLTNKKRLTYKSIFMSLWELFSIAAGVYYTVTLAPLKNILFKDWYVQLYNNQKHSPVSSEHTLTLAVLFARRFFRRSAFPQYILAARFASCGVFKFPVLHFSSFYFL